MQQELYTKLAGVSFDGRQEVARGLSVGAPLSLVREPSNPHDAHAVAVYTPDGVQIGYIRHQLALDLLARKVIPADLLVTHTYPLDRVAEAFETAASGQGLKVVVTAE